MRWIALVAFVAACAGNPVTDATTDQTVVDNDKDDDGFTSADGDCDDNDPLVYPGAWDVVADGKDSNCDGVPGQDDDGDGYAWTGSGGDDCDDEDPEIYLGADDFGWDGVDQDCDGEDRRDFDQICAGDQFTCALDSIGRLRCWGSDEHGQVGNRPLDARWKSLSCGTDFACAVSNDTGEVTCWGRNEVGINQVLNAPDTTGWESVHIGHTHGCVLDEYGNAECWGEDFSGSVSEVPVNATWDALGVGSRFACGILKGGNRVVSCWGEDRGDVVSTSPLQNVEANWNVNQVACGNTACCMIRSDLGVDCWGESDDQNRLPLNLAGNHGHIDFKDQFTCLVDEGDLDCHGEGGQGMATVPPRHEKYRFVATGFKHACAIRQLDGGIECWGLGTNDATAVPNW
ncbi:MAG: hypothetical protein KTR31_12445 [Myxococcales bacterium]|nr:hypothetical protein [Myxococcales bacterium]